MKKIILITLALSAFLWADFTRDDVNNTVTDNTTKLMWQDDNNGTVGAGMDWESAISHCEALTLGGYADWRLPNFNELYSIADRSTSNPAIDVIFQNVESTSNLDYYWSSTSIVSDLSTAWEVSFFGGWSNVGANKVDLNFVRCVRGGI